MSGAAIEAPYAIASLPKPLDKTHGCIQAAVVYSIRESKKRKRHEVAVGIDGEGVNIYNIQSQRLVTSHALPPQTYLCCQPCSAYIRATKPSPLAQRRTYIVVKDGVNDRRRSLVCFTENVGSGIDINDELSAPQTRTERKLDEGEIVSLDILPTTLSILPLIIINYTDGGIFSAAGDLSAVEKLVTSSQADEELVVEYASTLDAGTARKGLLRNREDIVSSLDQDPLNSPLLYRVGRSVNARRLELYSIRSSGQRSIQSQNSALHLLTTYDLPAPGDHSQSTARYELHAPSGNLFQLLDGKLHVFDVSGTVPKLVSEFGGRSQPVSSFTPVSAYMVATISNETATLYETKYGSTCASVPLSRSASADLQGKKRKRDDTALETADLALLSCFAELGLAVGLFTGGLTAMPISLAVLTSKRSRSRGTILADVLCKGSAKQTHNNDRSEKRQRKWEEWRMKVDSLIETNDIEGLETLVANDRKLGMQRKNDDQQPRHGKATTREVNGDRTAYEDLWPLPEFFDPLDIDKRKASYILAHVFARDDTAEAQLQIRIESTKLLEWFALTGYLSTERIRQAWMQTWPDSFSAQSSYIRPGHVMLAMRQIDPDFDLMHTLLSMPVQWHVEEVIQALRILLLSFDTSTADESLLALPAPLAQPNGHHAMTNGNVEMTNGDAESHLEEESKIAEQELDHAIAALSTGLEVRSATLRAILGRLHTISSDIVTATMKTLMSTKELIFFTHVMRIELADGGWTSKYVGTGIDDGEESMLKTKGGVEDSRGPSNEAIRTIADLLNCTVDAIGTNGWLVGQGSASLQTKELLDSLRAEVSAGLEGCYEADMLGTYLKDIERYQPSSERQSVRSGAGGVGEGADDAVDAVLPVGGRARPPVLHDRGGKSGKKSKVATARERRRRVGKYEFERIRI